MSCRDFHGPLWGHFLNLGGTQGDRLAFWAPMLAVLSVPCLALLEGGRGRS